MLSQHEHIAISKEYTINGDYYYYYYYYLNGVRMIGHRTTGHRAIGHDTTVIGTIGHNYFRS